MWFLRVLLIIGGLFIFPSISFAYSNPFNLSNSWEGENGDFYGEGDPHILKFEKKGAAEKISKHMEGFKQLLDYQRENELISKELHGVLMATTNSLIEKWEGI